MRGFMVSTPSLWLLCGIVILSLILIVRSDDDVTPLDQPGAGEMAGTTSLEGSQQGDSAQPVVTPGGEQAPTGGGSTNLPATEPSNQSTQSLPMSTTPVFQPNELGQIPILEYHHLGDVPEQFVRTPEQFRADLQWLYDNGFYVVNLHDILDDTMNVPAGKRPVALTFDDSPASQFRLLPLANGQLAVDPTSAVGIMETFFAAHPDFGRGGHFAVLPNMLFDWTPAEYEGNQTEYSQMKVQWLLDHGYELGNHTMDHANLANISNAEVKEQLALADDAIAAVAPSANVRVITLPYGMYPNGGDDKLLRGFTYDGQQYAWDAALLVGANPTVSPISTEYDPYAIARIQAFDAELTKWFEVIEANSDLIYVSDGDPTTVTVPNDLHSWIVGTLDESKVGTRELIRY